MTEPRLTQLFKLIDDANARDPHREITADGSTHPEAWLYGQRMTTRLQQFCPTASEALQIAARGQHLLRFEVPRNSFPDTRIGYLTWRTHLYGYHKDRMAELMAQAGYDQTLIERVGKLLQKRDLRNDPEVQILEDVACLVFLEFHLTDFVGKHDKPKLLHILQKTWGKMSDQAHRVALNLNYPDPIRALLVEALDTATPHQTDILV